MELWELFAIADRIDAPAAGATFAFLEVDIIPAITKRAVKPLPLGMGI